MCVYVFSVSTEEDLKKAMGIVEPEETEGVNVDQSCVYIHDSMRTHSIV